MVIKLRGEKSCNQKAKFSSSLLLNLLSSDFVCWIVALVECSFGRDAGNLKSDLGFFIKLVPSESVHSCKNGWNISAQS